MQLQVEMDVLKSSAKIKKLAHILSMLSHGTNSKVNIEYFTTKMVSLLLLLPVTDKSEANILSCSALPSLLSAQIKPRQNATQRLPNLSKAVAKSSSSHSREKMKAPTCGPRNSAFANSNYSLASLLMTRSTANCLRSNLMRF